MSQEDLANKVIQSDGVKHIPEMNAFMVRGTSDNKYSVTLFPKEKCQCPSTGTCYHIIAAKKSIGIQTKTQVNDRKLISLMRYKNRPKNQKRLGLKKQKPSDYETVIPAPDSKLIKSQAYDSNEINENNEINDNVYSPEEEPQSITFNESNQLNENQNNNENTAINDNFNSHNEESKTIKCNENKRSNDNPQNAKNKK